MKIRSRMIAFTAVAAVLGNALALAAPANPSPLPDEVKTARIRIAKNQPEDQASLMKLARISQRQAEAAALAAQPGKVMKARLDDEDRYLVWQIDVQHGKQTTEFAVDAGDGTLLAAEAEEDDDDHDHDTRK